MKARKPILILAAAAAFLIICLGAGALPADEGAPSDEELRDEIERQTEALDLAPLEEYFAELGSFTGEGMTSAEDFIAEYAGADPGGRPLDLWEILKARAKRELGRAAGAISSLASAAMLTALSGVVGDKGIKPILSFALSCTAAALAAGAFASLAGTAYDAVREAGKLTECAAPVMSALLVSMGSASSAGSFRPLMAFLSGTVVSLVEKAALPVVIAGGVFSIADAITDGKRVAELVKLCRTAAKWLLGLISTFYMGAAAVSGMTVAARDGVSLRTAKYAIDKLVPVVGNMVGGTVDAVMGCALLVKNGVGIAVILILLSRIARPLVVLAAGSLIFRAASAVCQPAADPNTVRLFSNAADTTSLLFACAAVTGAMLALTVLVFIASGGVTAGLW